MALSIFVILALLQGVIAYEGWLLARTSEGYEFFVKQDHSQVNWGIGALIPYSASSIDKQNRGVGPFSKQSVPNLRHRHWLGTDAIGRDVLAGMLHGTSIAFIVGFFSVVISFIIGAFLAYLSGYYGDRGIAVNKISALVLVPLSIIALFYMIYSGVLISVVLFVLVLLGWLVAWRKASRNPLRLMYIPADMIVFRSIDVFNSIPGLFLLLILLAMFASASIWSVILVIALLRWPVITRHLRAEILKLREEDYVASAKMIGLSDPVIFMRYILPMAVSPVIVVMAFGFSAAVLMESTLSFLGIGIPVDEVTWGSIIKQARSNFGMWWLALFPGLAIYTVVVLFNSIGRSINDSLRNQ